MADVKQLAKIRFPSRAYQLKQIRCVVNNAIKPCCTESRCVDDLVLAINEACMNIIQHGYGENEVGEIVLEILSSNNTLHFKLTDFAKPIKIEDIKPRDLNDIRPGGLGVHFIYEIMDEVKYTHREEGTGNVLELKKFLNHK